ncbi:hypothetical protein ACERNI_12910 [Camelimonas sp. ID_303_24]
MGKALKPVGMAAATLVAWLLVAPEQLAGVNAQLPAGAVLALDMDLRRPMFSRPSGGRSQPRAPARGAGRYQQAPAPQAQQRGFFDSLFGTPQRPRYQPGYRPRPPAVARPPRQEPRKTVRRPAPPAAAPRPAVEQTEFVYLLAPPAPGASLGEGLEAALADRPVAGVKMLRAGGEGGQGSGPDAAQLLAAAPAVLAGPDKTAVLVVVAAPEWAKLSEPQLGALVAGVSANMAARRAPVVWVGLPPVADKELSSRYAALNGALRAAADKAGGGFVDAWAVFADDGGGFAVYGPATTGERARLREDDGVALTRAGARKLAHFIMVEARRLQGRQAVTPAAPLIDPFSLPGPQQPAPAVAVSPPKPVAKPEVGPVLPLNLVRQEPDARLAPLDGGRQGLADAAARKALREGVPAAPEPGRADDFRWPRPGG